MFGFDKLYQFVLFGGLLLVMILLFVFFARPLFIALFVSILLTVLLKPLVKKLNRRFSHTTSVILSLVGFLGCGILIFILITGSILPALKNFVKDLPDILQGSAGLSTELANKYPWLGSPDVIGFTAGAASGAGGGGSSSSTASCGSRYRSMICFIRPT